MSLKRPLGAHEANEPHVLVRPEKKQIYGPAMWFINIYALGGSGVIVAGVILPSLRTAKPKNSMIRILFLKNGALSAYYSEDLKVFLSKFGDLAGKSIFSYIYIYVYIYINKPKTLLLNHIHIKLCFHGSSNLQLLPIIYIFHLISSLSLSIVDLNTTQTIQYTNLHVDLERSN